MSIVVALRTTRTRAPVASYIAASVASEKFSCDDVGFGNTPTVPCGRS